MALISPVALLISLSLVAQQQPPDERIVEVRRLLYQVSTLLPKIEDGPERDLLAANLSARMVEAGELTGALATANSLPDARGRSHALSIIAQVQAYAGQIDSATEIARLIPLDQVRETLLANFWKAYLRQGDAEAALKSILTLPDENSLRILGLVGIANWCLKNQQPALAARISQLLVTSVQARVDAARTPQELVHVASVLTFLSIAQIRGGDRAKGLETIGTIRSLVDKAPDERTKGSIREQLATALAGAGEVAKTLDALREVPESGRDRVLLEIAINRSNARDFPAALQLAHEIQGAEFRDRAYETIAGSQAVAGDTADYQETLKLIADPGARAAALQEIGQMQIRRQPAEARLTIDQAERDTRDLAEEGRQAELMKYLSGNRAEMRDFDRALELALQISVPVERAKALEGVLGSLTFRGEANRAYQIAKEQTMPIVQAYAWFGIAQGRARKGSPRRERDPGKRT